jgi:hypothetical protein
MDLKTRDSESRQCEIPRDVVTQCRTVGDSQWMLALNFILKIRCVPRKFGREQKPNLAVSIHWLPPTVLHCTAIEGIFPQNEF